MKIAQLNNVDSVIGVQKQHKFKITDQSQAIIMDSLINLYSDPIGSVVREITSNCIDANRERDLKIEGKIPMNEGDDQLFWSARQTVSIEYVEKNMILGIDECMMFHDHGCGLSEDRVANVFTTFGASTKRDNNYEIGGFGLGAKSPLAYTETFYVRSRHNGTETYYMLYRDNENVPNMDQVYQTSTEEKNGSTVIVPIKEWSDKSRFREAISDQLCFFDNIVFKGVIEGLGSVTQYYERDGHKSVIEEQENFILTNDGKDVELLVGRVVYPINWDQLELSEYDFKASMCVKFDIGVLDLVPSRESIRYTPKTIKVIEDKFRQVQENFKNDVSVEYSTITNYVDFLVATGGINSGNKYHTLKSHIPLSIKASMGEFTMYDIAFTPVPSMSPKKTNHDSGAFHHIFNGIHIYKICVSQNSRAIGGKTISRLEILSFQDIAKYLNDDCSIYEVDNKFSAAKEMSILDSSEYFICFKASKEKLGHRVSQTSANLVDARPEWQQVTMYNSVLKHMQAYSGWRDYNEVVELEISEGFGAIVDNKTRRKLNKEVFVKKAYVLGDGYSQGIAYNNYESKISTLQERLENEDNPLKYIVYAESKEDAWLEKALIILSSDTDNRDCRYHGTMYDVQNNVMCFKVSKSVAKDLKGLEGFINAKDLIMDTKNHNKLTKFYTGYRVSEMVDSVRFLSNFSKLHPPLHSAFKALSLYARNNRWNSWNTADVDSLVLEVLNIPGVDESILLNQDMKKHMTDTSEYVESIQLLNFVSFSSDEVWECVKDYLSLKGKAFGDAAIEVVLEEVPEEEIVEEVAEVEVEIETTNSLTA